MRCHLAHLLLFGLAHLGCVEVVAQRSALTPYDFKPLTSLPWKENKTAEMSEILQLIYLEPEALVRYTVLEAYIRQLPPNKIWSAFELCQPLEGTCRSDHIADIFMHVAAERSPRDALHKWTTFSDIAFGGWLAFDCWSQPKLDPANLDAFRRSKYLVSDEPDGYVIGLQRANLNIAERKQLLRDYACHWIDRHGTLPTTPSFTQAIPIDEREIDFLNPDWDEDSLRRILLSKTPMKGPVELAFAARAFALRFPKSMPVLLQLVDDQSKRVFLPSPGVLLCWLKADLTCMSDFIERCDRHADPTAPIVMGIMLSRVDEGTRTRWLPFVRRPDNLSNLPRLGEILSEWAKWNPKPALQAAVGTRDGSIIEDVAENAAFGLDSQCYNTCHAGLGVINDFDISALPAPLEKELINEWGIGIMEQWGDIDVAEAARYGLKFMLATNYAPRENLIKLFSGDDKYSSDSDMIDRTFCALRVWAAWKPAEMEKWIASLDDAEMQKALTWLKDNPWGTGAPE